MRRLIAALAVCACGRAKAPETHESPAAAPAREAAFGAPGGSGSDGSGSAAAAPATAPACALAAVPLRRPAPKRLVAIGDLHGDLAAARAALRTAGAIDERDAWIGGPDLVVVQTGDVLDRNDEEQEILDLFERLERDAHGNFIPLVGNHELMNAAGDYRYVTPGGFREFGGDRKAALGPGGPYAKRIAQHAVVAIVGDTVLSHAGVIGDWAAHVDDANQAARCWLDGQAGDAAARPAVLTADDSPVWTRAYGIDPPDCTALAAALEALGAKRMIVAHTVQAKGITSACDGALWRIDVGLGREYGGPIQVLEIEPALKILDGKRL